MIYIANAVTASPRKISSARRRERLARTDLGCGRSFIGAHARYGYCITVLIGDQVHLVAVQVSLKSLA
jgi:hypothetical protein